MIYYKSPEEIEIMGISAKLVCDVHVHLVQYLKEGITPMELDLLAFNFIQSQEAVPSFLNYKVGKNIYPNTLCISTNDVIVHGIPKLNNMPLKNGDIVSIDCGVFKNGFHGDIAYTYAIGEIKPEIKKLCEVTKQSLYKAIEACIPGNRIGDVGFAVQSYCEKNGYGVVEELTGHGLGRNLHEEPEVSNKGKKGNGIMLKPGLVIAIEPMINMGTKKVKWDNDGWTVRTKDGLPSAHYEHNVAITLNGNKLLSTYTDIENAVRKNINLTPIN